MQARLSLAVCTAACVCISLMEEITAQMTSCWRLSYKLQFYSWS